MAEPSRTEPALPPRGQWAVGGSLMLFMLSALLLLGVQGITLYDRYASTTEVGLDNRVWVFAQLEVEAKNFAVALLEGLVDPPALTGSEQEQRIRIAFDIYYSRTHTVSSVAREAFRDNEVLIRFEHLLRSSETIAATLDAYETLTPGDLRALYADIHADMPFIRRVANAAMLDSIAMAEAARESRHWIVGQLQLVLGLVIILMVLSVRQAMKVSRSVSHHAAETGKVAARLQRTLNASLDAVVIVDGEGNVVEHNAALCQILKRDPGARLAGLNVMGLITRADRQEIAVVIEALRRQAPLGAHELGRTQRINTHVFNAEGNLCPVELSCAVDQSADGGLAFIIFIRDRSQEVAAADVLRDARDQARLDAKAKERFLSVLSHEMRTPLHGVITSLELVRPTEIQISDRRFLLTAMACARSALTQVDDVLALTRNGYLGDPDEVFSPPNLIDDILTEIMPVAIELGNQIRFDLEGNARDMHILAKSRSFKLAVRNLISNAVKYTRNGEIRVLLTAQCQPEGMVGIEVSVQDTGIGIGPEDQARIFDEFTMVSDQGGPKTSGFGLGLAIAKSSVERLEGQLGLESEPGKGSRFHIRFKAPQATGAAPPEAEQPLLALPPEPAGHALHILIVDDNPVNLALLAEMVRRLGHQPDMAPDGLSALGMARERAYDMILMDLSMPGLDGFETARMIHVESGGSSPRLFALTARDLTECNEDLQRAGFEAAFQKPIGLPQLRDLINGTPTGTPWGFDPPQFPLLDNFPEVLALMGPKMTRRLAVAMLADTGRAIEALSGVATDPQERGVQIDLSHRAAGSAAVLGASRLAALLREIETTLRAGDTAPEATQLPRLKRLLPDCIDRTARALHEQLGDADIAAPPNHDAFVACGDSAGKGEVGGASPRPGGQDRPPQREVSPKADGRGCPAGRATYK